MYGARMYYTSINIKATKLFKKYDGNLLLSSILGATIHFTGNNRKGEDIKTLKNNLDQKGHKCFVIPYGGSNVTGAMGFVNAIKELGKMYSLKVIDLYGERPFNDEELQQMDEISVISRQKSISNTGLNRDELLERNTKIMGKKSKRIVKKKLIIVFDSKGKVPFSINLLHHYPN